MVRQAVLKNKDPGTLLEEMEQIDEMEYNPLQPSPLNEKVLKEKRKKLKETFDRVMRMVHEEEPEQWADYKRREVEYEKRRMKRVQYYESVRQVEQVSIEDIPLPSANTDNKPPPMMPPPKVSLPPPISMSNIQQPMMKKTDDFSQENRESREKIPPGVPSTLPVNLFEMRELDSDYESEKSESEEEEEEVEQDKHDKNIEEFMKEVDLYQKKKEDEKVLLDIRIDPTPEVELEESPEQVEIIPEPAPMMKPPEMPIPMPPAPAPYAFQPRMHHQMMFGPPPMRPMGLRAPPPPPNRPGMPRAMGLRMPPVPPPRHKFHQDRNMQQKDPKSATITAKPQIRNLSADVTRFVPSSLKGKREEPKKPKTKFNFPEAHRFASHNQQQQQKPTKDDAYNTFMSELKDLM